MDVVSNKNIQAEAGMNANERRLDQKHRRLIEYYDHRIYHGRTMDKGSER